MKLTPRNPLHGRYGRNVELREAVQRQLFDAPFAEQSVRHALVTLIMSLWDQGILREADILALLPDWKKPE